MYKKNKDFEAPAGDSKIWKYFDFTKFLSFLEKKALYFSRSDRLSDPHEGAYSKLNIPVIAGENGESGFLADYKKARRHVFLNCWHLNSHESAAMWNLYLKSDEGIAICSTYERLKKCFSPHSEDNIFVGKVKYMDYSRQKLPSGGILVPFLRKRKSFEHEKELRAIIYRPESKEDEDGVFAKADISELIEEIYVAPTAEVWIYDLVRSVIKRYGLEKKVTRSRLFDDPLF